MTTDFLIGAIRASRDLHPQVKTELEDILYAVENERQPMGKRGVLKIVAGQKRKPLRRSNEGAL